MNIDKTNSPNDCQEKPVKVPASKNNVVTVSPTRRSTRIRKPKISLDFCNIDKAFETSSVVKEGKEQQTHTDKPTNFAIEDQDSNNELTNLNNSLENGYTIFQMNNDTDETFGSMFDDIFGQKYTKPLQKLLPKQVNSESLKERKFFKTKSSDTTKLNFSNGYIGNKDLPAEDVSKVFKIISKPDIFSEKPCDSKSSSKLSLKTYSNKRKSFHNNTVVESFGLPDHPIVSDSIIKPITNNKLDAEIRDDREITILDLQHLEEPWIITNTEGECLFPYYEEIRIKAEPDDFQLDESFLDLIDADLETFDGNFCTSTPLNKNNVNNGVNICLTPINSKSYLTKKEIDIQALKLNFKKKLLRKEVGSDRQSKEDVLQKIKNVVENCQEIDHEISFADNNVTVKNKNLKNTNNLSLLEKRDKLSDNVKKTSRRCSVSLRLLRNKASINKKAKSDTKQTTGKQLKKLSVVAQATTTSPSNYVNRSTSRKLPKKLVDSHPAMCSKQRNVTNENKSTTMCNKKQENPEKGLPLNENPTTDCESSLVDSSSSQNIVVLDAKESTNCNQPDPNTDDNEEQEKEKNRVISSLTKMEKQLLESIELELIPDESTFAPPNPYRRMLRSSSQEREIVKPLVKDISTKRSQTSKKCMRNETATQNMPAVNRQNLDKPNLTCNQKELTDKLEDISATDTISCEKNKKDLNVSTDKDLGISSQLKVVITPLNLIQLPEKINTINASPVLRNLRSSKTVHCPPTPNLNSENMAKITNKGKIIENMSLSSNILNVDSSEVLATENTDDGGYKKIVEVQKIGNQEANEDLINTEPKSNELDLENDSTFVEVSKFGSIKENLENELTNGITVTKDTETCTDSSKPPIVDTQELKNNEESKNGSNGEEIEKNYICGQELDCSQMPETVSQSPENIICTTTQVLDSSEMSESDHTLSPQDKSDISELVVEPLNVNNVTEPLKSTDETARSHPRKSLRKCTAPDIEKLTNISNIEDLKGDRAKQNSNNVNNTRSQIEVDSNKSETAKQSNTPCTSKEKRVSRKLPNKEFTSLKVSADQKLTDTNSTNNVVDHELFETPNISTNSETYHTSLGKSEVRTRGRPRRRSVDRGSKRLPNSKEFTSLNVSTDQQLTNTGSTKMYNDVIDPELHEKPVVRGRGRPRRKSVDYTDVNKETKYTGKLRSKSVAPCSIRKSQDAWTDSKAETRHVKSNDTLKKSKSYSHGLNSSQLKDDIKKDNVIQKRKSSDYLNIKSAGGKDVKNLNTTDSLTGDQREFKVGDLAWAQIGSHPFWPCLITDEPGTGCCKKIGGVGKVKKMLFHVRFFGDNGRRAWVKKNLIILYNSKNDLQLLQDKLRNVKKGSLLRFCQVRTPKLTKWQNAVQEAERLKSKTIQDRLSFFRRSLQLKFLEKQKLVSTEVLKKEPNKRKLNELSSEENKMSETLQNDVSPLRKKLRKSQNDKSIVTKPLIVNNDLNKKPPSNEKNIVDEKPKASISDVDLSTDNIAKADIVQVENTVADDPTINDNGLRRSVRTLSQSIDNPETEPKPESGNSLNTEEVYSIEAQKILFKRNNLFKGVPRDKVCQYCLKPGDVLKCRGRCNGSYHVDCATKILEQRVLKKRREASKGGTENCNESSPNKAGKSPKNRSPKISNCEYNLRQKDKPPDDKLEAKPDEMLQMGLDDDHVQIISVPSSVYNTPPRKTFPPNFKNMSLAEQIDYKMKEIMRKFESKTFYAESSVDSSSSEESLVNQSHLEPSKPIRRNGTLCPVPETSLTEDTTSITENTASNMENCASVAEFSTITEVCKEVAITTVTTPKVNKTATSKIVRKSIIKHVTADCDSESVDDTQEKILNISGTSSEMSSAINPKLFKCGFCVSDLDPFCFICHQSVSKRGSSIRQKCSLYQCGRFYHPECLKMWPQTQWSLIQKTKHKDLDEAVDSFVCPLHVCHTCVSDDPRAATSRCSGDKIVKCLRCPSTYHSTNFCVPAGTSILSSTQILCPRHRDKSKMITINTTWCFLCSEGGNLICCETCPTSVHPECLPVNLTDDDKFICEDCESGRLPLYDEIVWVKLGKFKWWPALILFPNEVPSNILNIKHTTGEFVVKFFGTYDYYWVNRGRSFLFQEGDTGQCNTVKRKVDAAFNRAVEEAVVAHKLKKEFKLSQEAESTVSLKPPPYIRIKVNKPVGNVRQLDLDLSSTTACECDPNKPNPCGPDSDCLNRLLLTECSPDVCPAGTQCRNQSFEKREYPPLLPYKTQGRGWGLKSLAPIKKGQFVIEYVGELIDIEEYQRRIQKMHEQKEENYYFLTIDKDRMLDAGPKGNAARFMNHCCQPNCETQKWTVNGDTRVGLFATVDIPTDTELTFNYNLECVGKEKKVCRCGAPNCSGFIGVKAKQDTDLKKPKKPSVKKKKPEERIILPPCFICGRKGDVGACNNKVCNKTYHLECLEMTQWPEGNKFICPWHNCNMCSKRTIRCCVKCINSFCPSHSEGNIRYDRLVGFVCNKHDSTKISQTKHPSKLRKKRTPLITDETAVTSTTSDDVDTEDDMPLLLRSEKYKRRQVEVSFDSESETEFDCSKGQSHKRQRSPEDYDSQDEGAVSSATLSDDDDDIKPRKRARRQRLPQRRRKPKPEDTQNQNDTASSLLNRNNVTEHSNFKLSSMGCNR